MRITFDPLADAIYIEIKKDGFSRTGSLDNDETMIDIDKEGNVMGIEILDVSYRFPEGFVDELKSKKRLWGVPVEVFKNEHITEEVVQTTARKTSK